MERLKHDLDDLSLVEIYTISGIINVTRERVESVTYLHKLFRGRVEKRIMKRIVDFIHHHQQQVGIHR